MKLISFKTDIHIDESQPPCVKGKQYIISDGFLQQIKDNFSVESIESIIPFPVDPSKKYNGQDLTGKKLLVWRTGGMGDLCFITPNLRYIKENFKDSKIIFGCGPRFKYGMMNHPYVDELVGLPIDYELLLSADYYLMFEGIIESNEEAHHMNAYDLFEKAFGFQNKIEKDKKIPVLGLSTEHEKKHRALLADFLNKFPTQNQQNPLVVGIGLRASHIIRTIPPGIIDYMIKILLSNGCAVSLLGGQDDYEVVQSLPSAMDKRVFHAYKYSEDYRDTISHISMIDGVIGPDSSCVHIAAAFEKPVVGVYGAFPSRLRMPFYKNASGFDVKIACGPCFLHGIETCDYSNVQTKEPFCMYTHRPEVIVEEMLTILNAKSNAPNQPKNNPLQIA